MKKIILFITLFLSLFSLGAKTSKIGLFAGYPTTGLTLSFDNIEGHVGFYYDMENPSSNSLYISADYALYERRFTIGSTSGFFWNVGVGPYIHLTNDNFVLGALAPFEFGFNIPNFAENRLDVYLQAALGSSIIPRPDFVFGLGLGIRYKL